MKKTRPPAIDSVVVITVLTPDRRRCVQIDRLIDTAFEKDPRVQIIRVVGHPSSAQQAQLANAFGVPDGEG